MRRPSGARPAARACGPGAAPAASVHIAVAWLLAVGCACALAQPFRYSCLTTPLCALCAVRGRAAHVRRATVSVCVTPFYAATSVLRGRPRGRLRGMIAPSLSSPPPQPPQGSLRSSAPVRQASLASQPRHIALAASTSSGDSAKNSSGSSVHGRSRPTGSAVGLDLPCTEDPELFFAESPEDVETAKAMCRDCKVRLACLTGALERREPWGVWGGELLMRGAILPRKRPRGRPRKTEVAA